MKQRSLSPSFVDFIPPTLDEGVLYISIRYRTASHLCACGCGFKATTPIRPPQWHLYFDGDAVSLWPSVGSWQFPCRSHYWIKGNAIRWCEPWTEEQIAAGRKRDADDVQRYFESMDSKLNLGTLQDVDVDAKASTVLRFWKRMRRSR